VYSATARYNGVEAAEHFLTAVLMEHWMRCVNVHMSAVAKNEALTDAMNARK